MAWVFRRTKSGIHFKDLPEKLIIASPIFFLLFYANIYVPYLSNFSFLGNGFVFTQFIASFLLITIGFIAILLIAVRSIPGAFSLGFMIFFLNRYYVTQGYGNFDQDLLLICITLISLSVYLNKDRIPLSSAFFLVLIMITAMTATAWWVNYKNDATSGYEQMAGFIITHDGDYNESTWIFDDNGARFALRFYLHGNITANEHQPRLNEPFLDNKTSSMGRYMQKHPQLRFFIVTNRSLDGKMTPTSDYSNAYLWLKQHYVWVNPLLKIPDSHSIHLFAEKTVLSAEELQFLENYNK